MSSSTAAHSSDQSVSAVEKHVVRVEAVVKSHQTFITSLLKMLKQVSQNDQNFSSKVKSLTEAYNSSLKELPNKDNLISSSLASSSSSSSSSSNIVIRNKASSNVSEFINEKEENVTDDIKSEIQNLKKRISSIEDNDSSTSQVHEKFQKLKDKTKDQIKTLENQISESRSTIEALSSRYGQHSQEVVRIDGLLQSVSLQMSTIQADVQSLNADSVNLAIKRVKTDIEIIKTAITAIQDVTATSDDYEKMESKLKKVQKQILEFPEIRTNYDSMRKDIELLKQTVKRRESDSDVMQIKQILDNQQKSESSIRSQKYDIDEIKQSIKTFAVSKTVKSQFSKIKEQLDENNREMDQKISNLKTDISAKIRSLKSDVENCRPQGFNNVCQNVVDLSSDFHEYQSSSAARIDKIYSDLEEFKNKTKVSLQDTNNLFNQQLKESREDHEKQENELRSTFKKQLNNANEEVAKQIQGYKDDNSKKIGEFQSTIGNQFSVVKNEINEMVSQHKIQISKELEKSKENANQTLMMTQNEARNQLAKYQKEVELQIKGYQNQTNQKVEESQIALKNSFFEHQKETMNALKEKNKELNKRIKEHQEFTVKQLQENKEDVNIAINEQHEIIEKRLQESKDLTYQQIKDYQKSNEKQIKEFQENLNGQLLKAQEDSANQCRDYLQETNKKILDHQNFIDSEIQTSKEDLNKQLREFNEGIEKQLKETQENVKKSIEDTQNKSSRWIHDSEEKINLQLEETRKVVDKKIDDKSDALEKEIKNTNNAVDQKLEATQSNVDKQLYNNAKNSIEANTKVSQQIIDTEKALSKQIGKAHKNVIIVKEEIDDVKENVEHPKGCKDYVEIVDMSNFNIDENDPDIINFDHTKRNKINNKSENSDDDNVNNAQERGIALQEDISSDPVIIEIQEKIESLKEIINSKDKESKTNKISLDLNRIEKLEKKVSKQKETIQQLQQQYQQLQQKAQNADGNESKLDNSLLEAIGYDSQHVTEIAGSQSILINQHNLIKNYIISIKSKMEELTSKVQQLENTQNDLLCSKKFSNNESDDEENYRDNRKKHGKQHNESEIEPEEVQTRDISLISQSNVDQNNGEILQSLMCMKHEIKKLKLFVSSQPPQSSSPQNSNNDSRVDSLIASHNVVITQFNAIRQHLFKMETRIQENSNKVSQFDQQQSENSSIEEDRFSKIEDDIQQILEVLENKVLPHIHESKPHSNKPTKNEELYEIDFIDEDTEQLDSTVRCLKHEVKLLKKNYHTSVENIENYAKTLAGTSAQVVKSHNAIRNHLHELQENLLELTTRVDSMGVSEDIQYTINGLSLKVGELENNIKSSLQQNSENVVIQERTAAIDLDEQQNEKQNGNEKNNENNDDNDEKFDRKQQQVQINTITASQSQLVNQHNIIKKCLQIMQEDMLKISSKVDNDVSDEVQGRLDAFEVTLADIAEELRRLKALNSLSAPNSIEVINASSREGQKDFLKILEDLKKKVIELEDSLSGK